MRRESNGTVVIKTSSEEEMYEQLGVAHATDRGLQMLIMRILGKGRAAELLEGSDEMVEVDKFFRKLNWRNCSDELKKFDQRTIQLFECYNKGVNSVFSKKKPWELKLVGYHPEEWCTEDSVLLSRMTGFLTLAQSQGEMEMFLVQLIKKGISKEQLNELFPSILEGCDYELLKQVQSHDKIVPDEVKWLLDVAPMMASNNWVVSGNRTASGKTILCNDPHLETNRLPNIWYEVKCKVKERYFIGYTMPGLPAFLVGRNNNLSWGATYTFMDATDFWVETCKDGKYLLDGQWKDFKVREEVIKRKKGKEIKMSFYENEHGILVGDPFNEGKYFTMGWTGSSTGARSVNAFVRLFHADSVKDAQSLFKNVEVSFNWILADSDGNIGYQMSGLMPIRNKTWSGFFPIDGSDSDNSWNGFVEGDDLPNEFNPEKGYFVTANQNLNKYGKVNPSNISMADYRANRIEDLLSKNENASLNDMKSIQMDVYSKEAELLMPIIYPFLKDCENSKILKAWDFCYDLESKGAFLFECILRDLYFEIFGRQNFGKEAGAYLLENTGMFIGLYKNFSTIILKENSTWFKEEKSVIIERIVEKVMKIKPVKWGAQNQIVFKNIFFNGKLPGFLGFDPGPYGLIGGRATVHQGQLFNSRGRNTSFTPSIRFVTDHSRNEIETTFAGGASGNRFSKFYKNRIKDWLAGNYDVLSGET